MDLVADLVLSPTAIGRRIAPWFERRGLLTEQSVNRVLVAKTVLLRSLQAGIFYLTLRDLDLVTGDTACVKREPYVTPDSAGATEVQWSIVQKAFFTQRPLADATTRDFPCVTQAGPRPGVKCIFPFRVMGQKKTACETLPFREKWCATSVDSDGASVLGEYGYCGHCGLTEFKCDGPSMDNAGASAADFFNQSRAPESVTKSFSLPGQPTLQRSLLFAGGNRAVCRPFTAADDPGGTSLYNESAAAAAAAGAFAQHLCGGEDWGREHLRTWVQGLRSLVFFHAGCCALALLASAAWQWDLTRAPHKRPCYHRWFWCTPLKLCWYSNALSCLGFFTACCLVAAVAVCQRVYPGLPDDYDSWLWPAVRFPQAAALRRLGRERGLEVVLLPTAASVEILRWVAMQVRAIPLSHIARRDSQLPSSGHSTSPNMHVAMTTALCWWQRCLLSRLLLLIYPLI